MDFEAFMARAWDEHATQAAAVAERLETEGLASLPGPGALARLAQLAQHVHGTHLGQWQRGQRFQEALAVRAAQAAAAGGDGAALVPIRRFIAGLALAGGEPGARAALPAGERLAATALAATHLAEIDATRAGALLQQAADEEAALALDDGAPAIRSLAVAGNNIASALEEKPARSEAERGLMLQAAAAARRYWGRAGGWLETERAEYRLSMSHRLAGDATSARAHAQACLAIVQAQGDVALEAFFGHEALALAEHAAGDTAARATAVAAAAADFARLDEADRAWCGATLERLRALASPA
jgi:hypothetical protein